MRSPIPRLWLMLLLAALTYATTAQATPPLRWRGDSTTARSLAESLAKAWQRSGQGRMEVQPFNTISGIDEAISGQVDIAGSARPAFAKRSQESTLDFTPVAWDALVMIEHPDNPVRNITLRQLYNIYWGKITNWSQLGGRDAPINLYSIASPLDGVEYSLRKLLYGSGDVNVAAPRLYLNTQQLEVAVSLDPGGLGVSTLSNVFANPKLRMLDIEGVRPSVANLADGSYPLYTPLYFATNPSDPRAAEVSRLMAFLNTPRAQAIMREHMLIPYADATVLAAREGQRRSWIAARISGEAAPVAMNGPVAAPGATYSQGASIAPTSPLTEKARQRMLKQRARDKAAADDNSGG